MLRISNIKGFTMLELIVAGAILAMLSATALPYLVRFFEARQIRQQVSLLSDGFSLARSTALSNGVQASVCWNLGADVGNGAATNSLLVRGNSTSATPVIIKNIQIQPQGYQIFATASPNQCVTYTPQGRISNTVSFGVCKLGDTQTVNDKNQILTLQVGNTGRPSISADALGFVCV